MVNIDNETEHLHKTIKRADVLIQRVKLLTEDEVIPAVLQLRYAVVHMSEWIVTGNSDCRDKVKSHAQRAVFEAARYGIAFCVVAIRRFQEMFRGEILPDTITNYSEKMLKAQTAKDYVLTDGNEDERANICERSFEEISSVLYELIACQDVLNQRAEEKLKSVHDRIVKLTIAIASLVVSTVGVIIVKC